MERKSKIRFMGICVIYFVFLVLALPFQGYCVDRDGSMELNEKGVAAVKGRRFVEAEKLFRAALKKDEGNITAAYNLAGMYLTNNKPQLAVKVLEKYLSKQPKDAYFLSRLGDAYFALKNIKKAKVYYERAYKIKPTLSGLAGKLSVIYIFNKEPKKAQSVLKSALEKEPNNFEYLVNLANILIANKEPKEAVGVAKRAIQIKSESRAYVTLGTAYESLGDLDNALIAYRKGYELSSANDKFHKELKEKIRLLEKRRVKN